MQRASFVVVGALKGVGAFYVVLGVAGIIFPEGFGLVPPGRTDILLHFGTAVVLLGVAFMDKGDQRESGETRAI